MHRLRCRRNPPNINPFRVFLLLPVPASVHPPPQGYANQSPPHCFMLFLFTTIITCLPSVVTINIQILSSSAFICAGSVLRRCRILLPCRDNVPPSAMPKMRRHLCRASGSRTTKQTETAIRRPSASLFSPSYGRRMLSQVRRQAIKYCR